MADDMALDPRPHSFALDGECFSNLNDLSRFYAGLGRPLSKSAIVRRAVALLAHSVKQRTERPEELLMEMLVASAHAKLRPVPTAHDLRIPMGDQP